jgi:predicted nuclease with TOPRIM domain
MSKINYEVEIAAAQMLINALQRDIQNNNLLNRIASLQETIDKLQAQQAQLLARHKQLPTLLAEAQDRLQQLQTDNALANNAALKELLKLRDKINAQIAKKSK